MNDTKTEETHIEDFDDEESNIDFEDLAESVKTNEQKYEYV